MATHILENLDKNRIKLTVTIPVEESRPFLEAAAERISEQTKIDGFRPGKAGYDVIKQRVGEMKILEEALEPMVRKTFVAAVLENNIETVGSPKIDMEKMAPGNDIVYTAEVSQMPKIEKMAGYNSLSVEAKKPEVSEQDMNLALKDLQHMQTKEVIAKSDEKVTDKDKVVVNMDMKKEGVSVEGGQSPNHAIYLTEDYYIPGFKEHLLGMKEGEKKIFTLPFPKNHVQKFLAGAKIEFEVTINELYHLETPECDDSFAQSLGQKNAETLQNVLRENLQKEKDMEESFRQEKEMLELIAEKSKFGEIPELLINEEVNKMIHEIEHRIQEQGLEFDKYLQSIKKSIADLKLEFTPQAITRIKVALIIREIAKKEDIGADQAAVDQELDSRAARIEDPEAKKQIYSPVYREYVETMNRNRKVIEFLKAKMVK